MWWGGPKAGETTYEIAVKTSGAYVGAGTDATISLNLFDQEGIVSTGYFVIDNYFYDNFEEGSENRFVVNKKDVGLPAYIQIQMKGGMEDEWYCDYIRVNLKSDASKVANFPIYDWISEETGVAEGNAILPQKVKSKGIRLMREAEVSQNKIDFAWVPPPAKGDLAWGLPRFVNALNDAQLPKIFQRTISRQSNLTDNKILGGFNFIASLMETAFDKINSFKDYAHLHSDDLTQREIPNFLDDWDSDEVMARQVLTGINPCLLKRCTKLPCDFNVTDNDVSTFMTKGETLQGEIEAGKIYILNYKEILEGVPIQTHPKTNATFYCPTPYGLFYVNAEGKFLPIAIQLVPGDQNYLFTPADSQHDWLLAKMYLRCADLSHHEWISHFLLTHNIIEPFAVSMFRSFSRSHPLYKLLRPHLRSVSIINVEARISLVPATSLASGVIAFLAADTAKAAFKKFNFEELVIPKHLKNQGTDDSKLLPNYFYRDDALILWKAIENYVGGVVHYYYKNNTDVQEDNELQFWANDCAKEGLGWHDGNTRGMPDKITTIESLIEICTTLIFTSSVQHAAVNFGQWDTYKFAPNVPSAMRLPPHKKGEAGMKRILDSLPDAFMASAAITVAKTLSAFSPNEVYLGHFPEELFIEKPILDLQQTLRDELGTIENIIKQRNAKLKIPYTWLLPTRVPNSIAI